MIYSKEPFPAGTEVVVGIDQSLNDTGLGCFTFTEHLEPVSFYGLLSKTEGPGRYLERTLLQTNQVVEFLKQYKIKLLIYEYFQTGKVMSPLLYALYVSLCKATDDLGYPRIALKSIQRTSWFLGVRGDKHMTQDKVKEELDMTKRLNNNIADAYSLGAFGCDYVRYRLHGGAIKRSPTVYNKVDSWIKHNDLEYVGGCNGRI
jgi:hypothetical protein